MPCCWRPHGWLSTITHITSWSLWGVKMGGYVIPILQMRKPIPTEVKLPAQGCTAGPSWAGIERRCSGSCSYWGCPVMSGVNYWEIEDFWAAPKHDGLSLCRLPLPHTVPSARPGSISYPAVCAHQAFINTSKFTDQPAWMPCWDDQTKRWGFKSLGF